MAAPTLAREDGEATSYPAALHVDEIFVDDTYQRPCDIGRARAMSAAWDRRLAGMVDVSDRGEHHHPRYAIIDGQHRWAAAGYLDKPPTLVANVHEDLTVADEAVLFDKLNRQRKQPSPWDHWRARRASGDDKVLAIEQAARDHGLTVSDRVKDAHVWCISTLEKIAGSSGGVELLAAVFTVSTGAWGTIRPALEAPVLHGLAMVIYEFAETIDVNRLVDALQETPPARIKMRANTMRDAGTPGSLAKLFAVALADAYNRHDRRAPLHWHPRWRGVLPRSKAHPKPIPKPTPPAPPTGPGFGLVSQVDPVSGRELNPRLSPNYSGPTGAHPPSPDPAAPRRDPGGDREATAAAGHPAAAVDRSGPHSAFAAGSATRPASTPRLQEIGDPSKAKPRGIPDALPAAQFYTDAQADAVAAMEGHPVADIAAAVGIPERTVRRIHTDLGITT